MRVDQGMYIYSAEMFFEGRVKSGASVRKLLGREFQREIAEYMGERGAGRYSVLAGGSGCWCWVEGSLIFRALSGTKFEKMCAVRR